MKQFKDLTKNTQMWLTRAIVRNGFACKSSFDAEKLMKKRHLNEAEYIQFNDVYGIRLVILNGNLQIAYWKGNENQVKREAFIDATGITNFEVKGA